MDFPIKRLQRNYLFFWLFGILITLLFSKISFFSISKEINVSLESISVVFTLLGIWGIYKLFRTKLKNIISGHSNKDDRFIKYEKLFRLCMILLSGTIAVNAFVFGITHTYSSLLCIGMILIASMLIYPTRHKTISDLQLNEHN